MFGAAVDPVSLDGALVYDRDSLRVVRQLFEGLVAFAPGTVRVVPSLATGWRLRAGGRVVAFTLRRGVRFHDGTAFDAADVCANFVRWHRLGARSYYWQRAFGGVYRGCRLRGRYHVDLLLARPAPSVLPALALPSFGVARRAAGTGPFRLGEQAVGTVTLERFRRYWGPQPRVDELRFRAISEPAARRDALAEGEIDAYDVASPDELPALERERGVRLLTRAPVDVAYVGIGESVPSAVRRALVHGLDRRAVVRTQYRGRGLLARGLVPPALGPGARTPVPRFEPATARSLLRRAGWQLPVRIEVWYPTNVSRPYLPDPPRAYRALARGLERSGFRVVPRAVPWLPDYVRAVRRGEPEVYLSGWVADVPEAGAFLRSLDVDRAATAVPLAHSLGTVAVSRRVRGYVPSPLGVEPLARVRAG